MVRFALLTSVRAGACVAVTVAVAELDVRPLPEAVAVLVIEPASMSAWLIVRVEVHVIDAPGTSEPVGHETAGCLLSLTLNGPASVTFPVFVILYVYVITCPTAL